MGDLMSKCVFKSQQKSKITPIDCTPELLIKEPIRGETTLVLILSGAQSKCCCHGIKEIRFSGSVAGKEQEKK